MTNDFEQQLADCLHSHAEPVSAEPGMVGRVARRSRQLQRRRHAVAAMSLAPVTAGVAVGAVALAGHSSHPANHQVALRPLSSSSPSTAPTSSLFPSPDASPIDLGPLTQVCAAGQAPHLDVSDHAGPDEGIAVQDIVKGQPEIYQLIEPSKYSADKVVLTKDGKTVDGDALLLAANLKDGTIKRVWEAAVFPAGATETVNQALTGPVEQATFLGCVAAPSN